MATVTTKAFSGNEYVDALLETDTPGQVAYWTSGAAPTVISYYLSNDTINDPNGAAGGNDWLGFETTAIQHAFGAWSAVANITFSPVSDLASADLVEVIGGNSDVGSGTLGFHYLPAASGFFPGGDYIYGAYNSAGRGWDATGLQVGGYGYITLIHELGHGLGLKHPHDGPNPFPGVPTGNDARFGLFNLNQGIYTTMSYNDGWDAVQNPNGRGINAYGYQATPMAFDIAAIQHLYGANLSTNAVDTTYVMPDANAAGTTWTSIWDTGGTDEIVYNGAKGTVIDLRPATLDRSATGGGTLSWALGVLGGFTIAADITNALADENGVTGVIIENARGGSGADRITGNDVGNTIFGNSGHDRITALGGGDTLYGDNGNDTIDGGAGTDGITGDLGNDSLIGGAGDDGIDGGEGNDRLLGGDGNDTIFTGEGVDIALGGNGDDSLDAQGSAGAKKLHGEAGNDTISGASGRDLIDGGAGDDLAFGLFSNDTILGGAGSDQLHGEDGADSLRGGEGNDSVNGGSENDRLYGDNGADLLVGEAGNDIIDGGNDNDTIFGIQDNDNLAGGNDEDALFGGPGNDILNGGNGFDTLDGEDDNDNLNGGAGGDILLASAGLDTLNGGLGADLLVVLDAGGFDRIVGFSRIDDVIDLSAFGFADLAALVAASSNSRAGMVVNLDVDDKVTISGLTTTLAAADDFILAGQAGDGTGNTLTGTAAAESLHAHEGDDTVTGGAGRDLIDGGADDDSLAGGSEADTVTGGLGNDSIAGDGGADLLGGFAGNDTINGGTENDTIGGYEGDDQLLGDNGNDSLAGHDGNDTLTGGEGNDILMGGAGDDVLHADAGIDLLVGGLGFDNFVMDGGGGQDRISGFSRVEDVIDVSLFGFADLAALKLAAVDTRAGLLITLDLDDKMLVTGIKESQLAADDFIF